MLLTRTSLTPSGLALVAFALSAIILGPAALHVPLLLGLILMLASQKISFWKGIINHFQTSTPAIIALLILASLLFSSINGIAPAYSVDHWAIIAIIGTTSLLLHQCFSNLREDHVEFFYTCLSRCIVIMLGIALFIAFFEPYLIQIGLYDLGNEWTQTRLRFYSSVLAVLLPLCWTRWLCQPDGKLAFTNTNLLYICATGIMVIICAGRAGWTGMVASTAVLAFMLARYHNLRLNLRSTLKVSAAGIGAILASGLLYLVIYGASSVKERVGITVPDRGLGGGRLDIWKTAWNHMFDSPVFGIGVEAFRFLPGADYHPHDFLLQWGLEGGMVGLILCVTLTIWLLAQTFIRGKADLMTAAIFAGSIGFWVCALTNKSIFEETWITYQAILFAIALRKPAQLQKP